MKYKRSIALLAAICLVAVCIPAASAETPAPTESAVYLGDVDESGAADSSDARAVLQSAVGKRPLTDMTRFLADVNADTKIDSADARLILQIAVEKFERPTARVTDATASGKAEVLHSSFRQSLLPHR